jgi:hypothetical protein
MVNYHSLAFHTRTTILQSIRWPRNGGDAGGCADKNVVELLRSDKLQNTWHFFSRWKTEALEKQLTEKLIVIRLF